MGAKNQFAIDDRVRTQVIGQDGGAAGVPAVAMSFFRVHGTNTSR